MAVGIIIFVMTLTLSPSFGAGVAKFVFETVSEGKVAPLLPEEYVTNFIQHKWDLDGFGVSHVTTGTIWHSYSKKIIRADTAQHDWKSNNATVRGPRYASTQISVFDFNRADGQVDNLILNMRNMQTSQCNNYTIPIEASNFQLFASDALRTLNAGFSGQETFPEYGLCDKWTLFLGPIPITFLFAGDGSWIGVDYISPPPLKASVVNRYFNMDFTPGVIDNEVFQGIDNCSTRKI